MAHQDKTAPPLTDREFARVLNHLQHLTRDAGLSDRTLAEGLIRAGVLLLAVQDGCGDATDRTAQDMVERSVAWCRRMTERR
jgi:hypothetical protein